MSHVRYLSVAVAALAFALPAAAQQPDAEAKRQAAIAEAAKESGVAQMIIAARRLRRLEPVEVVSALMTDSDEKPDNPTSAQVRALLAAKQAKYHDKLQDAKKALEMSASMRARQTDEVKEKLDEMVKYQSAEAALWQFALDDTAKDIKFLTQLIAGTASEEARRDVIARKADLVKRAILVRLKAVVMYRIPVDGVAAEDVERLIVTREY